MSVAYVCDQCGCQMTEYERINLTGMARPKGAILLPERLHSSDFCSATCLREWVKPADKQEEVA